MLTKTSEVEGEWFLFEKDDHLDLIAQVIEGFLGEHGSSVAWMLNEGWIMTPVIIFRKR